MFSMCNDIFFILCEEKGIEEKRERQIEKKNVLEQIQKWRATCWPLDLKILEKPIQDKDSRPAGQ